MPVRQVCAELTVNLHELSTTVAGFISATVPAYLVLAESEHRVGVDTQLRMRLAALAERRALTAGELASAGDLAATRAAQGIPVDALIAAFQAGDQEIWREISEHGSPELAALMPELGRLMFAATSATTEVMARAHSRVLREIDGGRVTLAHQFLELLDDPAERAATALAATRLGFREDGDFVGMVWIPLRDAPDAAYKAAGALRSQSSDLVVRAVGRGRFELLSQTADADVLTASVADRFGGRLGIGLRRSGLQGARTSLSDARIALAGTGPSHPVVRFADRWTELLVLADADRVGVLTAHSVTVARAQPHLAETVLAYAAGGMSIAATARAVHLHANSVTYRLERWEELTGTNPRTFAGLCEAVISCRLAEQDV